MQLLGLVAALGSSLVGVAVGVRLLALSRRTKEAPERAMALAFLLLYLVGIPLAAVGRVPAMADSLLGRSLTFTGILSVAAGMGCFYVFCWKAFRPGSSWARWAVGVAWALLAFAMFGVGHALVVDPTLGSATIHRAARQLLVVAMGSQLWPAVESLMEWSKARRRVALGLSDPLVANRLGLWGLACSAGFLASMVSFVALGGGRAVFQMPLFQATITLSNLVTGTCWWLAFLPPRAWKQRVLSRVAR